MRIVLLFVLISRIFSSSAQHPYSQLKDNEMVLSYKILANVNPEQYGVQFTITQLGETTKECENAMNRRLKLFSDSLNHKLGIKPIDVNVQFLSFTPLFESEIKNFSNNYIERPRAYRLQKNIFIKTRKESHLEELALIAAQFEIYDLTSIECIHSQQHHILDSLRTLAIEGIDKKARKVEGLSLDLEDPVITVTENFGFSCLYDKSKFDQAETKGQYSTDAIRNKMNPVGKPLPTLSFKETANADYDFVVNPEHPNAGMKFYFQMFAKYAMEPNSELVNKSKFYIIDNSGAVKEVLMPKR